MLQSSIIYIPIYTNIFLTAIKTKISMTMQTLVNYQFVYINNVVAIAIYLFPI